LAFLSTVQQGNSGTFSTTYSVGYGSHRAEVFGAQLSHAVTMYRETPALADFVPAIGVHFASFEVFEVGPGERQVAGVGDGYYSCSKATVRASWACQGPYRGIGMGGTFDLTAPYPPTELARGLANAAYSYLRLDAGPPAPDETGYFFTRSILGQERRCLGFGSAHRLVGSACWGPDNVGGYYDLPAAVSLDTYRSATLLSFSVDVDGSVFRLPTAPVAAHELR
jgi:hypothetical protein